MFTGIITALGHIESISHLGDGAQYGKKLHIRTPAHYLDDVSLGDSIAINGACMTVTSLEADNTIFTVDVSAESLDKTTGLDREGEVNLEKALAAHDRLGGHIVSGHVDGIGHVSHFAPVGESWELRVKAPKSLAHYFAYKGSVAVQGVSLTINSVKDNEQDCEFSINLIPHTVENTALKLLKTGDPVNLEVDVIARYTARMLGKDEAQH